jgi:hypothetical protein
VAVPTAEDVRAWVDGHDPDGIPVEVYSPAL